MDRDLDRKIPNSPSNLRGGHNSYNLQQLYDHCLSDDSYVQVTDGKVKQIIRRMLNVADNQPLIISIPVYLLAVLKTKNAPLIIQKGGTQLVIENVRAFISKGLGTILLGGLVVSPSMQVVVPLLLAFGISFFAYVNCDSFVDTLPKLQDNAQYIETLVKDDAPIIVAPHTSKPLYYEFEETPYTSLKCYIQDNCLGPNTIPEKLPKHRKFFRNSKTKSTQSTKKKWVPLSQRTKTLKDLKSPIDDVDAIDLKNVKYKQKIKEINEEL